MISNSPGVPRALPTVVASSATPILAGPPIKGVIATPGAALFSTQTTNVWPQVLIESGVVVSPFTSYTPIVLPTEVGFPTFP